MKHNPSELEVLLLSSPATHIQSFINTKCTVVTNEIKYNYMIHAIYLSKSSQNRIRLLLPHFEVMKP